MAISYITEGVKTNSTGWLYYLRSTEKALVDYVAKGVKAKSSLGYKKSTQKEHLLNTWRVMRKKYYLIYL